MKKLLLSIIFAATALLSNAEGSGWYFVYDGNGWATDENTEFKTTDTPDVYLLANYAVTADAAKGGFNYQITNKGWSKMYGWCAEADGNDKVGSTYKLGTIGNAWINCESGSYDITFNAKDETILFATPNTAGIEGVTTDKSEKAEYFTISGVRVNNNEMSAGLYIKKQGNSVSKVIVK